VLAAGKTSRVFVDSVYNYPMPDALKILYLSAEVVPFAKTGGLGDVGGSLPKALAARGHDVRVVMPAYRAIETDYYAGRGGLTARPTGLLVPVRGGGVPAGVLQGLLPGSDVPIYFIAERGLFDRPELYGYNDDPYRFLGLLETGSTGNYSKYSNPAYDAALKNANATLDNKARLKLLADAEAMLFKDEPVIPVFYYGRRYLVKPYVQGFEPNQRAVNPSRYLSIRR